MFWLVLIFITAACWYLALTTPAGTYPRDWRLKPFHLSRQEEQDFHKSVRRVVALTLAIFFSVCLIIALVTKLFGNDRGHPDALGANLKQLNDLGNDGWEMVTVDPRILRAAPRVKPSALTTSGAPLNRG